MKNPFLKSTVDYLIVGLGNPGLEYEKTRHNLGFRCMDVLCEQQDIALNKVKFNARFAAGSLGAKRCLFLKPQTYMNNSGESVAAAMRFYKLRPEQLLVIFDDISLPVGRLRIRQKGSAGGHNGVKSIIELLGSDAFLRIKIGCGQKPTPAYNLADWVLGKFPPEDEKIIQQVLPCAAEAAACVVEKGAEAAMGRDNG